jgi:hypothetical protein
MNDGKIIIFVCTVCRRHDRMKRLYGEGQCANHILWFPDHELLPEDSLTPEYLWLHDQ